MRAPHFTRLARPLARGLLAPVALAIPALVVACRDEPTGTAPQRVESTADARPLADVGLLATVPLPFFGSVNSAGYAFSITQTGTGAAGYFNSSSMGSAMGVDALTSGVGPALRAMNSGKGVGGFFATSDPANTSPALRVSSLGNGPAVEVKSSHSTTTAPGLKVTMTGPGPAASFTAKTVTLTRPAFVITNQGIGRALLVNHTGADGSLAVFQVGGDTKARISRTGKGYFDGGTQTGGADVAEAFAVEGGAQDYGPGDVLVISTTSDRAVTRSGEPYSTLVAGVYATKPGVLLTERGIDDPLAGTVPLGVVGVIPTKVSAENGPIHRGDLLVTAATPGHAMRGTDRERMLWAVLGRALEPFAGPGTATIRVLVNVR